MNTTPNAPIKSSKLAPLALPLLLLTLFVASCALRESAKVADLAASPLPPNVNMESSSETASDMPQVAPPPELSTFFLGYWFDEESGKTVRRWMEDRGGMAVVEGDMILGPSKNFKSAGTAKSTFNASSRRWPRATVYYEVPTNLPGADKVRQAIQEFSRTKILLIPRTNQTDWIRFELFPEPAPGKADPFAEVGGDSPYGRQGGMQLVRLNRYSKFTKGTVVHELCHALGQAHEQIRQDRDSFVRIITANVVLDSSGKPHKASVAQFEKLNNGKDYFKYDFDSISHYWEGAFAQNGKKTIVPRPDLQPGTYVGNPNYFGRNDKLSTGDVDGINEHYRQEIQARGDSVPAPSSGLIGDAKKTGTKWPWQ